MKRILAQELLALVCALAVSSTAKAFESAQPVCAPGASQACACTNGLSGAQVCREDRSGWGPCVCEPRGVPAKPAGPKPAIEWVVSKPAGISFAKTETTVAQYRSCVDAGVCKRDTFAEGTCSNRGTFYSDNTKDCNWGCAGENHPMNCVTWDGGKAFCEWAGGRLPTDDEWKAEAFDRGLRGYPWGNEAPGCDRAVLTNTDADGVGHLGCGKSGTWPVCSKEQGNSVSGLCDMCGNVEEWTGTPNPKYEGMLVRGGSWGVLMPEQLRVSWQSGWAPATRNAPLGFRCVRKSP